MPSCTCHTHIMTLQQLYVMEDYVSILNLSLEPCVDFSKLALILNDKEPWPKLLTTLLRSRGSEILSVDNVCYNVSEELRHTLGKVEEQGQPCRTWRNYRLTDTKVATVQLLIPLSSRVANTVRDWTSLSRLAANTCKMSILPGHVVLPLIFLK